MIAIPTGFSAKEYLELERQAFNRHEYRRGLVYAMAGGSDDHSRLSINLLTELNLHLREGDCQFFSGDVKVNYAEDFYYYPDAFVTCDPQDRKDKYIKRHPKLIAEVLSPSTSNFDRNEKFEDYKSLNALEEYVLISQERMQVDCYRRLPSNRWEMKTYEEGEQVIFQSIGLVVAIADLYRGIEGL